MNITILMGRLTKDPELKKSKNLKDYTNFNLAVNKFFNGTESVDFIPCIAWGKVAVNIVNNLKKGSLVSIEGNLSAKNFEKDLEIRTFVSVTINKVNFLGIKKSNKYKEETFDNNEISTFDLDVVNNFSNEEKKYEAPKQSFSDDDDDSILWD